MIRRNVAAAVPRRRAAGSVLLVAALLVVAPTDPSFATTGAVTAAATGSAVTVSGRKGVFDDFSALKVTVSQTRDLANQGIEISWTGGAPTGDGAFWGKNYLQIMQCWGADPNAADFRETCQYGRGRVPADARDAIGLGQGNNTRGFLAPDPNDELLAAKALSVPFRSVGGARTPDGSKAHPYLDDDKDGNGENDGLSAYFSEYTTNEIPYARTTFDGTGQVVFEVQTNTEAPGLGCGVTVRVGGTRAPRPCWLVIVPRGEHDATGRRVDGRKNGRLLDGSPLSATFFANRIAVKLQFQPVDRYCPDGKQERLTVGSELVEQAIRSWQPALCARNGPVFGYSSAGDGEAAQFISDPVIGAPGLAFVTEPVKRPTVVHAPVALGAAVIALQIETKINPTSDPELEKKRGTLVRDLKLTPRLVAKLLTQSYRSDVPGGTLADAPEYLAKNYNSIVDDPEFTDLNKDFKFFARNARPDGLMVTAGNSALASQVWQWVLADPVAREWLKNGKSSDTTMVLNENYRKIFAAAGPPEDFPKAESRCVQAPGAKAEWCTLDLRPYVGSLQDASVQTLRGDAKPKIVWDPNAQPPAFRTAPPQPIGQRFALSITDGASAARYGLVTAKLRNRHGDFVAPTSRSLLAATAAMQPGAVAGVLQTKPDKAVAGAYPLTMLTYAAVNLEQPQAARKDYAALLRYAAGPGQTPGTLTGQLPAGYVPLPERLRAQAATVAGQVLRNRPGTAAPAGGGTAGSPPDVPGPAGVTGPQPQPAPTGVPAAGAPPVTSPPGAPPAGSGAGITPVALTTRGYPVGPMRFAVLVILGVGLLGAVCGPVLLRISRRGRR